MPETTAQPRGPVDSAVDVVRATGDVVKSAARFSLAVSLYAAREASSLLSGAGERSTRSMEDVVKAASGQLSGPVRTAYSVGTNLQSGVVDLAFSLAGLGPRGQQPAGDTSALSIPMMAGGTRRVTGVRTVSSGAVHRPVPQEELVATLTRYQTEAAATPGDLQSITIGLWKSEGFSTSIGKHLLPENTFADPRLPRAALPIAHVGFGSGSTEMLVFDPARLHALFEARTAPEYREFAYEGIGAILRIYERGFFKVMSGALGLIRLDAPDGPAPTDFFADYFSQFSPGIQRLIAHGYGRIIAFSNMNIYRALQEITTLPPERVEAAAHGAAFAFAFMNSADLPRILEESAIPFDARVRASFQSGLVYSLVFFEWYVPGLLDAWRPVGRLEQELVDQARAETALARQRGYPLAFRLQNPRT